MYPHERSLVNNMQGRPFVLLGVNNDDELSTVKKAIRKNKLNWRSWYDGDNGPIVEQFEIRAFPTIFLVDHTGVIRYKNLRGPRLDQALEELVTEAESAGMTGEVVARAAEFHTYRDATGKHSVFAMFKSFADGQITLEKRDGSEIQVALDSLSRRDQEYLEENGYLVETTAKPEESSTRLFTDATGEFKVRATLVRVNNDNEVTLRKEDGTEITVPLDKFSESDQRYIRQQSGG